MMRHSIRRVLTVISTAALAAATLVVLPASAATADPIPISAVDFEDGTTGAWTASGGGPGTLSVVDIEGGKALLVTDRDADYVGLQSPAGIYTPGSSYSFSMRTRLAEGTVGTAGVRFVMKPSYTWIGDTTMTADAWTTVTGEFTVPADADAASLQVYIGTADLTGPYSYLVDDIEVTTDDGGTPGAEVVPGGAVNPVPTPVGLAQGTGDVAALTFDDGPNPGTTPALLDYLAANDIRAVFCVIGQNITAPGGADILKRIVAEGHTLCNHSTTYDDMGSLSQSAARERMAQNLEIIRTALGDPNAQVPFFRAPNGSWGQTPAAAVSLGMQPLAVVNTINDWATQDVPTLTANLRAAIKPGEIVLTHDGGGDRNGTLAAVTTVVSERLAAGWEFTLPVGTPASESTTAISTDFEDGLDGWAPRDSGSGAPSVGITTADAHAGAQAAAVTARTSQGSGIGRDVTGILETGVTYDLSAWVRFAPGQPTDAVWLSMARTNDGATSYSTIGQFTGVTNSGWSEVTATFTMGPAESALLYFETNYNGTNTSDLLFDDITVATPGPGTVEDLLPLKDTADFPVGVAIDSRETTGPASDLLLRHFDQVTSENYMKPEAWYDAAGEFTPNPEADTLMAYAQDNDLRVYGHTLAWHSQTPAFFFQDDDGQPLTDGEADQQILRDRLRTHIYSVAQHLSDTYGEFGGDTNPLVAFDVVNEVVSDGNEYEDGLRRSEWYRILGEEFIDLAFQYADDAFNGEFAAEGSDRPITLIINDYNTEQTGKQARLHALVERMLARGVPVDGVGHQFHVSLSFPVTALEDAIVAFEDLPVTQAVTELDVTTGTPVTPASLIEQAYYYRDAFRAFREHADDLFSVTVWGLTDGRSWRSGSGAPLLFDDALQGKPAYYGAADLDLPARPRTANVFQGDVPLDADAPASLEWRKLPLNTIDESASFQLRWSPDHLTAYVRVEDATPEVTDGVAFEYGGSTVTAGRTGGGDVDAVVAERDGGYDMVATLPLSTAVAQGATLDLDVRVTDGTTVRGWNTPGALGTLTLLEPVSYLEVAATADAPAIDGSVDPAWSVAGSIVTEKQVEGTGGATATVRTLWRDQTLYVLAEVADPVVDVTGSDPWIQDSVEIFVDPGNAKNGSYRYDDSQIRISAANAVSFGTGDEPFQRNRVQSATTLVDGGYVVEAAISLLEYGGEGTFHGLDFQVNDASNGQRSGIRNWADPTGAGYQSTARWGVGQLVAAEAPEPTAVVNTVVPSISGTPEVGRTLQADAGTWEPAGATFAYQWQADGVDIPSATAATYRVKRADAGSAISVVVTASAPGLDSGTAASESVAVLATSRTSLSLSRVLSIGNQRTTATIVVRSAAALEGGTVQVTVNGAAVGAPVAVGADGRVSVTLPRLRTGIYIVRAEFSGTPTTSGSTSGVGLLVQLF
ncbi:endo-1,4-beta-xylanase [Microbacterium sp. P01]|uniref:endo-1,4-beta-xylanase n=1 Tax=Microbacterium sp. P01 TaxID=3366261 RepID=UPI00367226E0